MQQLAGRACWFVLVLVLPAAMGAMLLQSPEFKNYEDIPAEYGCDPFYPDQLQGPSPPLEWHRTPAKASTHRLCLATRSFVLVVDDIDSEDEFVQWVVYDIPADTTKLEADASRYALPEGAKELHNSAGTTGFALMCPINVTHSYRFRLFAMRTETFEFGELPEGQKVRRSWVDKELQRSEDDVIYVATLTGKMYIQGYDPSLPRPPPPVIIVKTTDPIPMRRYVKPSERFKNTRPHNNPRPLADEKEICNRSLASDSSKQYAQLCKEVNIDSHRLEEMIEKGGVELGGSESALLSGAKASKQAKSLSHAVAAVQQSRPPAPRGVPAKVTGPELDVEEEMLEYSGEAEGLLQWKCSDSDPETPLVLRSPVVDTCVEGYPVLPAEFSCDAHDPEAFRTSPPLAWRLQGPANSTCGVHSFVLLLEDTESGKVNWLVTDISPAVSNYGIGRSGLNNDLRFGREQLNSYRSASYRAPCATSAGPRLYRMHLLAQSSSSTKLHAPDEMKVDELLKAMSESTCFTTHLDFGVRQ